jgi:uncharacterized protein
MRFQWDSTKARINRRKHGVSFEEAAECFGDPLALLLEDPDRPERCILIGESRSCRLIFTVFAELLDAETIRIISARKTTRAERRRYEDDDH